MFQKTILVFALALVSAFGQAPPPGGRGGSGGRGGFGRGGPAIKSPEVSADGKLTARLRAPNAQQVMLTGFGQPIAMQKNDQGVWTATTDVLKPDVYMYQFSVDGMTVNDPSNPNLATSFGTGGRSVVTIPGPVAWAPVAGVAKGAITRFSYHSDVAGDDRDFYVYTPAGYDPKRKEAYPVLYLLHGLGDDAQSWLTQGNANVVLDNLIAQGKAKPMIMVNPLGYGHAGGGQGAPDMLVHFGDALLNEVMPRVEKEFNVAKDRDHRAIAGLSMGGAESTFVGLNHLDKFAYIGSFSGAYVMWPGANGGGRGAGGGSGAAGRGPGPGPAAAGAPGGAPGASGGRGGGRGGQQTLAPAIIDNNFGTLTAKINPQVKLLWIVCGTADGLLGVNRQFKDWLTAKNIKFTQQEVPDMAHVWPLWRQNLTDLAPMLFTGK
jgi:enterochelin esterase family protein